MRILSLCALGLALFLSLGCDRNVAPFDPEEKVQPPDLSRIFPRGAERAAKQDAKAEAPSVAASRPGPRGSGAPIRGTLTLAPDLEKKVPAGSVLFLIARSASAGPPIAVKRISDPRFPMEFEIGPGDRMIATVPFAGPLRISARVDSDGNATSRTPGDLQGAVASPVQPGANGVHLVIDEVL